MDPIIDPRLGDVEDDASSTKHRSLFLMAGSLLAEISLPKLVLALLTMIVVPAVLLGLAPLVISAAYAILSTRGASELVGIVPILLLVLSAALVWFGGRTLFRAVERSFWSLNSLAVQPGYLLCRETLRHLAESFLRANATAESRARVRAVSAAAAGIALCILAVCIVALVWPSSRWIGNVADLSFPHRLIVPALANSVVVMGLFLSATSLLWGIADATMDRPRDLTVFDSAHSETRTWRIVHLSDLHVVGGRYEFRIESGRSGPRGNSMVVEVLARLDAINTQQPVDLVLITGDVTDTGRSTEWAEFFAALAGHPRLAERMLIIPGNHDLNIVDRANPARLELPISSGKRLRQMRALSAIAAIQGERVLVIDRKSGRPGKTLSAELAPYRDTIREFADTGSILLGARLARVWDDTFPMVLPPDRADGLGVVLLNSNAETHFSFTNALGLVPAMQARELLAATRQFPRAHWIVALHHHVVEYPKPVETLAGRVGAALINDSWFVRQLRPLSGRVVAMHGHRHYDWIGECGGARIVSAPSPVMGAAGRQAAYFYIHTLAAGPNGQLCIMPPERVDIETCAGDGGRPTVNRLRI